MTTARLFATLLLFSARRGNNANGGFAAWLPAAQAFAPTVLRKEATLSKFPREATTDRPHRSRSRPLRRRQRQPPAEVPIVLRIRNSSSGDDSIDASAAADNAKRLFLPLTAFVALSLATLAAYTGNLPGPPIDATAPPPFFSTLPYGVSFSGSCGSYTPTLIVRDVLSTVLCIAGAAAFVKGVTYPSVMGYIEPRDARKIIHTCSVPLFLLLWPLFSNAYGARVFAGIVPLLNALRLFVAGTGGGGGGDSGGGSAVGSEAELAGAISRSGDAKEALGGPFIYVIVMLVSTLFFWTDSPVGVVSMANMALGDGLADLIGRRFGSSNKWFFNKSKSMAGSAAFVAGSFAGSYGLILWLTSMGAMDPLPLDTVGLVGRLLVIAVMCAGVELIPVGDDNWSVPLSAALLSVFLLN